MISKIVSRADSSLDGFPAFVRSRCCAASFSSISCSVCCSASSSSGILPFVFSSPRGVLTVR